VGRSVRDGELPVAEQPLPFVTPAADRWSLRSVLGREWRRMVIGVGIIGLLTAFGVRQLHLNIGNILAELRQTSPGFLSVALGIYYVSILLRAWRWQYILHGSLPPPPSPQPRLRSLTAMYLWSWLLNCLTPAKLGELYRGYLLKRAAPVGLSQALGSVVVERAADLLGLCTLFLVAIGATFGGALASPLRRWVLWAIALAVCTGLVLWLFVRFRETLARMLPPRFQSIYRGLEAGVLGARQEIPKILVLTAAIWGLEGVRFYFAALALGLALPMLIAFLAALLASLLTTLPITPSGLGFVEAGVTGALVLAGFAPDQAVAVTLVDRIVAYWSVLVIVPPLWLAAIALERWFRAHRA